MNSVLHVFLRPNFLSFMFTYERLCFLRLAMFILERFIILPRISTVFYCFYIYSVPYVRLVMGKGRHVALGAAYLYSYCVASIRVPFSLIIYTAMFLCAGGCTLNDSSRVLHVLRRTMTFCRAPYFPSPSLPLTPPPLASQGRFYLEVFIIYSASAYFLFGVCKR